MKLRVCVVFGLVLISCVADARAQAQQPAAAPADQAQVISTVESYLRNLFGWGSAYQVKLGPLKPSMLPGFYEVPVAVTFQQQTDTGTVYASKDGKFIIRGELYDTSADPFAEIRAKLLTSDSPAVGPADAKVTVVEFSDFECPHCRTLSQTLKTLVPKYPQVRFVFKNFPLTQIHPWAMTAALAGRCAFQSSEDAFWKMQDSIFQQQDLISTENVYDKLADFAAAAGLNREEFRACLAAPEAQKSVESDIQMGKALNITSTPTVFVNGRENIGGDPAALDQIIDFELKHADGANQKPRTL